MREGAEGRGAADVAVEGAARAGRCRTEVGPLAMEGSVNLSDCAQAGSGRRRHGRGGWDGALRELVDGGFVFVRRGMRMGAGQSVSVLR